jgi:tRNA (mo5U34)-methyltransferase
MNIPHWKETKARKETLSAKFHKIATTTTISHPTPPLSNHLASPFEDMLRHKVEAEPYWFQKIELSPGYYSPGWSDAALDKLPYFGFPEDLTGKRVLDIGCAEGFFSFEAERRGAREVIGIDSFPDSVRRFNIVKDALQSNATAYLMNVYDLDATRLGTFDVVLFYGVFYHLKHPQLALESIRRVCVGEFLFQTVVSEEPALKGVPWAKYNPYGTLSGPNNENYDPTNFWFFNSECCVAMLDAVGFVDVQAVTNEPGKPFVLRASSPHIEPGAPPDQAEAPWS